MHDLSGGRSVSLVLARAQHGFESTKFVRREERIPTMKRGQFQQNHHSNTGSLQVEAFHKFHPAAMRQLEKSHARAHPVDSS